MIQTSLSLFTARIPAHICNLAQQDCSWAVPVSLPPVRQMPQVHACLTFWQTSLARLCHTDRLYVCTCCTPGRTHFHASLVLVRLSRPISPPDQIKVRYNVVCNPSPTRHERMSYVCVSWLKCKLTACMFGMHSQHRCNRHSVFVCCWAGKAAYAHPQRIDRLLHQRHPTLLSVAQCDGCLEHRIALCPQADPQCRCNGRQRRDRGLPSSRCTGAYTL